MISEHVQARRLFAAPDDSNEVLASTNTGLLLPFKVDFDTSSNKNKCKNSANRRENNTEVECCSERLHLCESSARNPFIRLPYPAIDVAWCPFKRQNENAAVMIACNSQPLQLWDVCFNGSHSTESHESSNINDRNDDDDDDDNNDDGNISERNELRASYLAYNNSNMHVYPHAVCWLNHNSNNSSNNSSNSNMSCASFVAAGYGGFEDKTCIRVFDVCVEGDSSVWSYSSPRVQLLPSHRTRARRTVSSLANGPISVQDHLLLCGYYNYDAIEVIDTRHRTQALLLHDLGSVGVGCIRTLPELPYCVFASGRGSNKRNQSIVCWDVRKANRVLARLERCSMSTQLCEMSFVYNNSNSNTSAEKTNNNNNIKEFLCEEKKQKEKIENIVNDNSNTISLVSTSSSIDTVHGGIVIYNDIVKLIKNGQSYHSHGITGTKMFTHLGSTSGLCTLSQSRIAVVTGCRTYSLTHLHDKIGKLESEDDDCICNNTIRRYVTPPTSQSKRRRSNSVTSSSSLTSTSTSTYSSMSIEHNNEVDNNEVDNKNDKIVVNGTRSTT